MTPSGTKGATAVGQPASAPFKAPAWLGEEEEATPPHGDPIFGVGRAPRMKNRALARSLAENRARAAVADRLRERRGSYPGSEVHLQQVEIVDHWTDPESGAIFARARFVPDGASSASP